MLRHGPLMALGFLGTLIVTERAVGFRYPWLWAGVAASALGTLLLLAGGPERAAGVSFAGAALLVALAFSLHLVRRRDAAGAAMLLGALAWAVSAGAFAAGVSQPRLALWWAAFLVLTIVGERLELGRFGIRSPFGWSAFVSGLALVVAGALAGFASTEIGAGAAGAGFALLAIWGLRHDIVRRTVRIPGRARFSAAALLAGYAWLGAAAVLWPIAAPTFAGGLRYDAALHALFLGFVLSMVFGHAPTILPAVTGVRLRFTRLFYGHLALLHAGVVVRVLGDLAGEPDLRRVGAELNVAAVLLFLVVTAGAGIASRAPLGRLNEGGSGAPAR